MNNPQGVYYGGQVAAPIIRQLYENILPYLGIEGAAGQDVETLADNLVSERKGR